MSISTINAHISPYTHVYDSVFLYMSLVCTSQPFMTLYAHTDMFTDMGNAGNVGKLGMGDTEVVDMGDATEWVTWVTLVRRVTWVTR